MLLNLPNLPLPDSPPGDSYLCILCRNAQGQYFARIYEDRTLIDVVTPFTTNPVECLMTVSRNYPQAIFKPKDYHH